MLEPWPWQATATLCHVDASQHLLDYDGYCTGPDTNPQVNHHEWNWNQYKKSQLADTNKKDTGIVQAGLLRNRPLTPSVPRATVASTNPTTNFY